MQKSKALSDAAKDRLGSGARKGSFLSVPAAPSSPWVPAAPRSGRGSCLGDPLVVPVDLIPQVAALYQEAGAAEWAVPVCQLLRDRPPPSGRCGAAKGVWRVPEFSAGPELSHRSPGEVLNFWTPGLPADGNGEAVLHPSHFTP